jgi:uncharacterized membrane protein
MFESILSKTSLPNLHPGLVHFPIVLFTCALIIDLFALLIPRKDWLRKTATLLFIVAAVSAGITFWSGSQAADSLDVPLHAQAVLSHHEDFALYTLWFFGIYALLRMLVAGFSSYRRWAHLLLLVLAIGGEILVTVTADYGGALVYKHAVGVRFPEAKPPIKTIPENVPVLPSGVGPTVEGQDISWTFGNGSDKRLLEFMEVARGPFSPDTQAKIQTERDRTFLVISQKDNHRTILTFKPTYENVQVEADIDLSAFQGTVALVHHLFSPQSFDFFRIDNKVAQLGRSDGDMEVIFEDKGVEKLNDVVHIKAVGSSGHFRGYINGKLFLHGHADDAPAGKAGILFEGTGTIRLAGISANSLGEAHEHMDGEHMEHEKEK